MLKWLWLLGSTWHYYSTRFKPSKPNEILSFPFNREHSCFYWSVRSKLFPTYSYTHRGFSAFVIWLQNGKFEHEKKSREASPFFRAAGLKHSGLIIFFCKNSVKTTHFQMVYLKCCFHEIFFKYEQISHFSTLFTFHQLFVYNFARPLCLSFRRAAVDRRADVNDREGYNHSGAKRFKQQ